MTGHTTPHETEVIEMPFEIVEDLLAEYQRIESMLDALDDLTTVVSQIADRNFAHTALYHR